MGVARPVGKQKPMNCVEKSGIQGMLLKNHSKHESDATAHDIEFVKKATAGIRGDQWESEGAVICSPEPVAGIS